ncbi:hypothetical protein ACFE04_022346 [Oxalis oulophora]
MCSVDKAKVTTGIDMIISPLARINGRPVLQPTCNRVASLDGRTSFKKLPKLDNKPSLPPAALKSPRPPAIKRSSGSDNMTTSGLNSSSEKVVIPKMIKTLGQKSKSFKEGSVGYGSTVDQSMSYCSSLIVESPGSIAAGRREHVALQQAQRKSRIAHYGRSKSAKFENELVANNIINNKVVLLDDSNNNKAGGGIIEEKRCSFITLNSDPIYVKYHDEEWGVPVHDDKMLFELLVLSGAQVGSDWTSILKKRQEYRNAFSRFDAEVVAQLTDKQIVSISTEYSIDISRVRAVVDNSNQIIQIVKEFGSFDKYIWGFVNHKPISPSYKFGHKIPVKTSKSESISKDMVRRGFRFVGPTMIHSFMQAAGLTNDHLITCRSHLACTLLAARSSVNH